MNLESIEAKLNYFGENLVRLSKSDRSLRLQVSALWMAVLILAVRSCV